MFLIDWKKYSIRYTERGCVAISKYVPFYGRERKWDAHAD